MTRFGRLLRAIVLIAALLTLGALYAERNGDSRQEAEAARKGVVPTLLFVDFYGEASTLDGHPLPVGARLTVYDPQGIECGVFVVTVAGEYGVLPVYGDDLTTPEDEGARPGELLTFQINGLPARLMGPDEARWTQIGDLKHVELAAGQASNTSTPRPALETPTAPAAIGATSTPVAAATSTSAPASTQVPAATATGAPATPTGAISPPSTAIAPNFTPTPPALAINPTRAVATTVPTAGGSIATAPSGTSTTPNSIPSSATQSPASVGARLPAGNGPTPDTLAVLGLANPTPGSVGAGSEQKAPTASGQRPASDSSTPINPAGVSPTPLPEVAGYQSGADSGNLVMGMAVVLILITTFLWIRRRFL